MVHSSRAFLTSGVDYAGPIKLRASKGRGHVAHKGYICVLSDKGGPFGGRFRPVDWLSDMLSWPPCAILQPVEAVIRSSGATMGRTFRESALSFSLCLEWPRNSMDGLGNT